VGCKKKKKETSKLNADANTDPREKVELYSYQSLILVGVKAISTTAHSCPVIHARVNSKSHVNSKYSHSVVVHRAMSRLQRCESWTLAQNSLALVPELAVICDEDNVDLSRYFS
jgi:hypothetical protein